MEGLKNEREAIQRQATRQLGYPKDFYNRVFGVQVKGLGNELDNLALPIGGCTEIQDAIGRNMFVVGFSTPGGPDIVPGSSEDTHPW